MYPDSIGSAFKEILTIIINLLFKFLNLQRSSSLRTICKCISIIRTHTLTNIKSNVIQKASYFSLNFHTC